MRDKWIEIILDSMAYLACFGAGIMVGATLVAFLMGLVGWLQ